MPSIADALDLQRYDELRRDAEMALNLWDAFRLAVERGDGEIAKHHARQIAVLTRTTLALVKRLGEAEPDTAFGRDAKAWRQERDNGQ
jgi:hypothetical protein